jgi:hypothetical protein
MGKMTRRKQIGKGELKVSAEAEERRRRLGRYRCRKNYMDRWGRNYVIGELWKEGERVEVIAARMGIHRCTAYRVLAHQDLMVHDLFSALLYLSDLIAAVRRFNKGGE